MLLENPETRRLVCKLRDDIDLGDDNDATWVWTKLLDPRLSEQGQVFSTRRLFQSLPSDKLRGFSRSAVHGEVRLANLNSYFLVTLPNTANISQLIHEIRAARDIELAYVDPDSGLPSQSEPENDPLFGEQDYLNPAKGGIDIRAAWNVDGDGRGVCFADVEKDWSLVHLDLIDKQVEELTLPKVTVQPQGSEFSPHGTRVLQVVLAQDNRLGIIGMAHNVARGKAFVASCINTHRADAIALAAARVQQEGGGVLLIELQQDGAGCLPIEAAQAEFHAIQTAAFQSPSAPVVVVECAGNGETNIDPALAVLGADSGAIMVGAVKSGVTHRKLLKSNFGTRVNCHAWGEKVRTSEDDTFNGTSSAGAIIAGVCCVVQSVNKQRLGTFLTSVEMRTKLTSFPLVRQPRRGPRPPGNDLVGVMPDLQKIIDSIHT